MTLLEIIFGGLIINFLGINTRYYFFRIFNKNLKKEDFKNDKDDIGAQFSQGFYNFLVGLIVFCILSIVIVYIAYKLKFL
ncbi:hypothetical protein LF887_04305 [Chryseobacterium sp. MEBOG06]|uniref:hypothetical protein n=1 Tax=Chryseobacterium sp. MEBOG06 TaxID=2879938 RepID=UPI001F39C370|nr:hypothetical protein [Chryseobacterium sp. MEBOG06]UKB84863.1 hypothetical protein LF887_04305 [Chryseobacterium sp. MEBOG06]